MAMNSDLPNIDQLKLVNATVSAAGLADLESKGWRVLERFTPANGNTYCLIGLPVVESPEAIRIKQLEAELAALRG